MSVAVVLALAASGAAAAPRTVADMPCPPLPIVSAARTMLLIDPQPHSAPLPPASAADKASYMRWQAVDPDGLCRYRDENRRLPPATPGRVVFIGDSITETWRLAMPGLFAGDVLDRGVSGQTTTQMLARFRQDVIDLHPAIVHIMGGINDIHRAPGTAATLSNIQSMVELARAHGIAVVLGSVTPASGSTTAAHVVWLNRQLRDHATRGGMAFVDYHAALRDAASEMRDGLSNDGLHPNRRGFEIMTPLARAAIGRAERKSSPGA